MPFEIACRLRSQLRLQFLVIHVGAERVLLLVRLLLCSAGEMLFVPGGAPHAVENVTDCLAIAGNFVDESNLQAERDWMAWVAAPGVYGR